MLLKKMSFTHRSCLLNYGRSILTCLSSFFSHRVQGIINLKKMQLQLGKQKLLELKCDANNCHRNTKFFIPKPPSLNLSNVYKLILELFHGSYVPRGVKLINVWVGLFFVHRCTASSIQRSP